MVSRVQEQLPAMLALAHQRTEGARIELAGMLADICLAPNSSLSLREQEMVNELIDQLMHSNSPALRAQLVDRFSDMSRMPRMMAVSLAHDSIETATKVLLTCENFSDSDLISVVESQSSDHAAAIAHRKVVSEAVADALVTTGDVRIMNIVAQNMGAKLTPKAITIVTDAARFSPELREPIMKRNEMTCEPALRLYWWVSHDLRRYALKRFGISSGQVDQALAKTIDDLLSYHQLDKSKDDVMTQIADWLEERHALSAKILPQILRLGHFRLFNIALSRLSNLDIASVDAIVSGEGGRELAVLCRALGIDKSGFVSIFLLSRAARQDDHVVHPRELSLALAAYDRLSTNLAHDLIHTWRQDPSYLLKQEEDVILEA
jgi:uncharacterized protein (DUF2336 family)